MGVSEHRIFWEKVAEAVKQCETNHERKIEFTLSGKKATVVYSITPKEVIVVMIEDVPIEVTKDALIVP